MIVLILENVPTSLRGELTRWLIEPRAGVFVGRVSTIVREKLWSLVRARMDPNSGATLLYSSPGEQGFQMLSAGTTRRRVINSDGALLVQRDHPDRERALRKLSASLPRDAPRQQLPSLATMTSPRVIQKAREASVPSTSSAVEPQEKGGEPADPPPGQRPP